MRGFFGEVMGSWIKPHFLLESVRDLSHIKNNY
jgi:hypothetical protein